MKLLKSIALAGVGVFTLTSCATHPVRHIESDYYLDLYWSDTSQTYNILQLTDLHISNMANNERHFKFIKKTVEKAKEKLGKNPDLIVITGDLFTFANKSDAIDTFNFFDSLQIPWAPTWGNHDEQNYFSVNWLTSQLNDRNKNRLADKSSYCVFKDLQDDDIFGNANYVINLKDNNDKIIEQLFIFDSNRYNYGEGFGYDYIHYDQIDWYERIVNTNTKVEGSSLVRVPSLAFFHIPFPEFEEGYQHALKGEEGWSFFSDDMGERKDHDSSTGDPKKNTGLFDKMLTLGSTKGVFIGHNHTSNYLIQHSKPGPDPIIKLCFGIKSTNKVYCDENFLGGQIISVNSGGNFEIKRITTKYSEIE